MPLPLTKDFIVFTKPIEGPVMHCTKLEPIEWSSNREEALLMDRNDAGDVVRRVPEAWAAAVSSPPPEAIDAAMAADRQEVE